MLVINQVAISDIASFVHFWWEKVYFKTIFEDIFLILQQILTELLYIFGIIRAFLKHLGPSDLTKK